MYRINGTVTGHTAGYVLAKAHHAVTGDFLGQARLIEGAYQVDVPTGDDCYVVLLPDIGDRWHTGRFHGLGERVYPVDYKAMPYYYVCTGAGIVGQYEPNFIADPLKAIPDGECVWERVERIPFPLIHFPVTPILI